jgi:LPXTG-motif cell wall-anchored protein
MSHKLTGTNTRVRPLNAYALGEYQQLGFAVVPLASGLLKVASAIPGIGKVIMGSRRPESDLWDAYKGMAGSTPGHAYDPQFRNGAFVGLMRLKKNTFPPRMSKYGANDDARFLDDMAKEIAGAVRAGRLGASDDANSVFAKVVNPWVSAMGDWSKSPADWQNWMRQILIDQIDAYLYDLPIVATSYTTSRHASPRLSEVVKELQPPSPTAPIAPVAPVSSIPAGPPPAASIAPAQPAVPFVAVAPGVSVPAASPNLTPEFIQSLLQRGASETQAFTAALQSLSAQGIAPTPQVQAQVAADVQRASTGGDDYTVPILIGVGFVGLALMLSSRRRKAA